MKIYFCTTAPSNKIKSWSNIPFMLHKNLEKQGCSIVNYEMREVEPFKSLFNFPIRILIKYFNVKTNYFYVRTPLHFFITSFVSLWIKLISNKSDVILVQGFSYPVNNKKNKHIILGDWPSEYLFEIFLNRKPSLCERKSIDRENKIIESADAVITLFPNVRDYMLKKYKNKNIFYLGNVVNVEDEILVPSDVLKIKLTSKRLLFIGQPQYILGAQELINASLSLRSIGYECQVDIVGIPAKLLGINYEWVNIHGYLDKDNPQDKLKYYELLINARLLINTNRGWSGFQAILEALFFYTPIIVRKNDMLINYFDNLEDVAYLLKDGNNSLDELIIDSFINLDRYKLMTEAASRSVEPYTWKNFTDKLIKLIKFLNN